ncbi:MAG: glycosyl transferase family 2 [Planctomycetes bacterium RBG_16_64_12]|nr:MAG: glycosyl transferase family 2 [Planctomycetes bacterium RBG_16_64_12]
MLSVVIPVLDEAQSVKKLHEELSEVADSRAYDMEVIFVDDGSTDGSWEAIERVAGVDPRVRGIRFRRNFGKAAALSAGFAEAGGELIMTLDADLQDDPDEIPNFLAEMEKDLDVVSGWKKVRHDPWHKVIPSRVFNWMVSRLTGVILHDHNCGMKCYRREVFDEVRLYGELHRFVPVLAAARGFRVGELVIQHRPRRFGRSKYGIMRIIKGFLDLLTVKFLTGFGQRPQHVLGTCGVGSFVLGFLGLAGLAACWLWSRSLAFAGLITVPEGKTLEEMLFHLHDHPTVALYSVALLLLGGQLISMGFLAELLIAYHDPEVKAYSISQRTAAKKGTGPICAKHPSGGHQPKVGPGKLDLSPFSPENPPLRDP